MSDLLDRIRGALVGLRMPRALETLDHTLHRLEQGEITGIEAIDELLDVVDKGCDAWSFLAESPKLVASITSREWATVSN